MQTLGPTASRHGAAGELINDDDLAVAHDVLDVAPIERMSAQRGVQMVHQPDVGGVVEALALAQQARADHQRFDAFVTGLAEVHLALFLVDRIVAGAFRFVASGRRPLHALETRHQTVDGDIGLGALLGRPRDDERRARFVNEDGVDLVDDRERERALHTVIQTERKIVAQVVEAELVVGAVGDVAGVSRALLLRRLPVADHTDGQAKEPVDGAHPIGVALREVFVDRDDVHALPRQGVEIRRQGRHERLALAGAHLRDATAVQGETADQLDIEMPHPEGSTSRLAHHGEGLWRELVQGLPGGEPSAELGGLGTDRLVGQGLQRRLEADRGERLTQRGLDEAVVATAEEAGKQVEHARGTPGKRSNILRGYAADTQNCKSGEVRGRPPDDPNPEGSAPDIGQRVDGRPVSQNFEMQMGAGRSPRGAHPGDLLATADHLPDPHVEL